MKKNLLFLLFFLHAATGHTIVVAARYGIVVTPIADLVGSPIQTFFPEMSVDKAYQQLVLCGAEKKLWIGCPRLHQLIAHEMVEVLDQTQNEYKIKTPHLFYVTGATQEQHNCFWTDKKNIVLVEELEQNKTVSLAQFPSFNKNNPTIVLVKPFFDNKTNQTYSVGTRFVCKQITNKQATIFTYDPQNHKGSSTKIDAHYYCLQPKTEEQQKKLFVRLLKYWTQPEHIAYVFGGCSFTEPCSKNFEKKTADHKPLAYTRIESENKTKNGFDCAGIIVRAAQAAGLDFPYKNTHTIKECLPHLSIADQIVEGDLIWIPGHVMAVSNTKEHRLVEARSYSHGYGIVQEIELCKVFKDIKTYDDLLQAFKTKTKIQRLDSSGVVRDTISDLKLIKFGYRPHA
jgi:hypothetical protein